MYRLYNLFARLNGRLSLPAPGQQLEQVFLAFTAFSDQALPLALQVVREALDKVACSKGAEAAVIGLSPANPLFNILTKALPVLTYSTCLQTVTQSGQSVPILSSRPVQPEAALL
jgi:hypothetical protein